MKRVVLSSERTLRECRKRGWIADKVERWVPIRGHPAGGIRKDFLGAFDIIAFERGPIANCIGIQSCSMSGRAAHMAKLRAGDQNPDSRGLLEGDVGVQALGAAPRVEDNARPM